MMLCVRDSSPHMDVTPIRHRAFRLTKLQRLLDRAIERGRHELALRILEQATMEMGNIYVQQ